MDTVINGREAKEQRRMERLVVLLEDWADWMRGYRIATGYKKHSTVVAAAGNKHWEDILVQVDAQINRTVDTAINDLPINQMAAINHRYLHAVYRFPRDNYAESLTAAHETLMRVLPKKNVDLGN